MKKVEKYINNNRQAFEEEPAAGHFERFVQKADKRKHVTISWQRRSMAVAASLLLLFSAGVLFQHFNRPADFIMVCEDAGDVKQCYLSKMNDVAYHIETLTKELNMDEWGQEAVMEEVENLLQANDGIENEIPEELPAETTNAILANHYQHNLEQLQDIAKSLEENK